MTKEAIAKAPEGRVRRTPVGRRAVLSVEGQDPNYHYRVVNDTGNRIDRFLAAGYELVQGDSVKVGDSRVGKASPIGSTAEVEVGGGKKAQVMRIRKEWHEEDQAAKQAHVDATEAATLETARTNSDYGEVGFKKS